MIREEYAMTIEKGNISVHTQNMFPIIKKWLYSDRDIFLRELISNSCDAISKLKRIVSLGEAEIEDAPKYRIDVVFNKNAKILKIIDNGIGMTNEEVKKYITQVAFSSAEEFLEKYKDENDTSSQIIGHFGLGFYSAFMVADKVQIDTLSYQKDAKAVKWVCDGGTEYEISNSDKTTRGTEITLFITEDSEEFLEEFKLREILNKYCAFLPVEIFLYNEEDAKEKDKQEEPINDTNPLWLKKPSECKEEEYKDFYRKVFFDFNEPLFWIHLNVDFPFKLKGILYFPKLKHEFETIEGMIKLFNNQVFVADNIKEVIPEFLMLLKGVIDCPDLPLNVSRSFLQNDGYVKKISGHIIKKVADKLVSIYKNKREEYNAYWDDINPFIKYGCIRDDKFYDRVKDILIFKTTNNEYVTLSEYVDKNKEKHMNKVYYVSDEKQQSQYINIFKQQGLEAVILPTIIDGHFIQFLEGKESDIKFNRIDSDVSDSLKDNNSEKVDEKISKKIEKIFKEVINSDKLKIQLENLNADKIPAMILLSEQSRRMQEMSKMFGGMDANMFPEEQTLVINNKNELVKKIISLSEDKAKKEDVNMMCEHVYDLAMLSHKQLDSQSMTKFIERSNELLIKFADKE
jgi:molecular chaperone HtpG